ncbi:MAG: T9SS type A sorting domain-containing protein, partial [Bacteroidales bacterium]
REISVFPNPVKEGFHVRIRNTLDERYSMELYRLDGRRVAEQEPAYLEAGEHYFETSGLDPGLYLLKFRSGNQTIIKRIVKL